jgi:hypothetical protein
MSISNEEWLRRYLDGELDQDDERLALHRIADDPELRSMLRFDLILRSELASPRSGVSESVPKEFFDGVMKAIRLKSTPEPEAATLREAAMAETQVHDGVPGADRSRTNGWWNRIWQPRAILWRPAWSAGIAALLLLFMSLSLWYTATWNIADMESTMPAGEIPARQIVEQTADHVMMRFVYVDSNAESIAVAGDFSDWEPISLNRQTFNGDVAWTGIIPLPRGEHRYMFIVDGEQWTTDPLAHHQVNDGFGNKNAVIHL